MLLLPLTHDQKDMSIVWFVDRNSTSTSLIASERIGGKGAARLESDCTNAFVHVFARSLKGLDLAGRPSSSSRSEIESVTGLSGWGQTRCSAGPSRTVCVGRAGRLCHVL